MGFCSDGQPPNNSFKPNLLRCTKHMAERACHVFGSTTQVGLTQALGTNCRLAADIKPRDRSDAAVHFVNSSITLRRIGWLLFWSLAAASALAVLLFLLVALPALIAIAQGGSGDV